MIPDIKEIPPTLSVVMPIALDEPTIDATAWRMQPGEGMQSRISLAFLSIARHFPLDELQDFLIITPNHEVEKVRQLVTRFVEPDKVTVISETELCPGLPSAVPGWYLQQIIKLAAADYLRSTHYLTMDSDIICVKPFKVASLFRNSRALMNLENIQDYLALYTDERVRTEVTTKARRYQASADLLGYRRNAAEHPYFFGETPVVMHRASVRNLTAQLEHRHSRPWRLTLANERKWTEYGLYFQFLEATGALLSHHEPAGCNSVLDLYHSVWQATEWYRDERKYDQHHFNPDVMTGYFIAVQSWLEPKYWLPSQYANADQFFASLRGFLGLDKL